MFLSAALTTLIGFAPWALASPMMSKRDPGVGIYASSDTKWTSSDSPFITLDGDLEYHFQTDGNLVLYAPGGNVLWNSGTGGRNCGVGGCMLAFQADGNFIAYDHGNAYWATNTYSNQFHQWPGYAIFFAKQDPYIEIFTKQGQDYVPDDMIWWTSGYNGYKTHHPTGDDDTGERGSGMPPGTSGTPDCSSGNCHICYRRDLTITEHIRNALPWTPADRIVRRCGEFTGPDAPSGGA